MLRLDRVVSNITDPSLSEQFHRLDHAGSIEYITLDQEDIKRKRLRVLTDKGTDCAITLERDQSLENGSVLCLESTRAIVVRLPETQWLELKVSNINAALELGYFAGNLHWQVEVVGEVLRIALTGSEQAYLERLAPLIKSGRVEYINHD